MLALFYKLKFPILFADTISIQRMKGKNKMKIKGRIEKVTLSVASKKVKIQEEGSDCSQEMTLAAYKKYVKPLIDNNTVIEEVEYLLSKPLDWEPSIKI